MRSSFANFKYSTGDFLDIKEVIEKSVNKHDELKALSKCVDKPYEYVLRGFNLYSELKNGELKIGLRRSKGSVNVYEILNGIYEGDADELAKGLDEYAKNLSEFVRSFDKFTNLISFCSNRDKKINGGLFIYGVGALNGIRKLDEPDIEFFARLYLRFLLLEGNYFRHPDTLFENVKDIGDIFKIPRYPDKDDEYLVKILPEKIANGYSSDRLRLFMEDLKNIECQNGELNMGIDSFEIMLLVQSLVNEGENLFTLDGKSITNLLKDGDLDYSKVEIHHIFPKNSGKEKDRRNNLMNLTLLSADKNKVISDKEPKEYWNNIRKDAKDFKKMLRMNIIPHGKFYAGKVKDLEPVSYEDTAPEDECKFWSKRLKLFVDALYKIYSI